MVDLNSGTIGEEERFDCHKQSSDQALAFDYALGILIEPDLGCVLIRIKQDVDFSLLVSRYIDKISVEVADVGQIEDAEIPPLVQTWNAIVARISTTGNC